MWKVMCVASDSRFEIRDSEEIEADLDMLYVLEEN